MAIEVKRYTCVFRCGHRAIAKKADMEAHEEICWRNPIVRACHTCKHGAVEDDSDGYSLFVKYRTCSHGRGGDLCESFPGTSTDLSRGNARPFPVAFCPFWNGEDDFSTKLSELHDDYRTWVSTKVEVASYTEKVDDLPF